MKQKIVLSPLAHTWVFDIDGTICKHNGYLIDGYDTILDGVKEFFEQIPKNDMIVFFTSRKEQYRDITIKFLNDNNLRYDEILFEVPQGERIVVNDDKPSGLEMSKAICLKRNGKMPKHIIIDKNR